MLKVVSLAVMGALSLASAAQVQSSIPQGSVRVPAPIATMQQMEGPESLAVYYTPLASTEVSRFVGFGTAYHMAIVYTGRGRPKLWGQLRTLQPEGTAVPEQRADRPRIGRQQRAVGVRHSRVRSEQQHRLRQGQPDRLLHERFGAARLSEHGYRSRTRSISAMGVDSADVHQGWPASADVFAHQPELEQSGRHGPAAGPASPCSSRARPCSRRGASRGCL